MGYFWIVGLFRSPGLLVCWSYVIWIASSFWNCPEIKKIACSRLSGNDRKSGRIPHVADPARRPPARVFRRWSPLTESLEKAIPNDPARFFLTWRLFSSSFMANVYGRTLKIKHSISCSSSSLSSFPFCFISDVRYASNRVLIRIASLEFGIFSSPWSCTLLNTFGSCCSSVFPVRTSLHSARIIKTSEQYSPVPPRLVNKIYWLAMYRETFLI